MSVIEECGGHIITTKIKTEQKSRNSFLYRVIRRFRIEYEFYKFACKDGQSEGYMGRYREYQRKCNDL